MTTTRAKRKKAPKHDTVVRAYAFPLEVNLAHSDKLFKVKNLCWEAREYLVAQRVENRKHNQALRAAGQPVKYLSRDDQYKQVALLARDDRRFAALHSQVLQNVAVRVDEGTKRWLEARRDGRKNVNPPGPILAKDYLSFTYPQYGTSAHVQGGKLHLSKLGEFRLLAYRKMRGQPKTVTVKFEDGRWWAVITCALQPKDVYRSDEVVAHLPDVGADPGLSTLLTLADGTTFDPPKPLKEALSKLRRAQRDMSRKFRVREVQHDAEQARRRATKAAPLPPLRETPYSNRLKEQIKCVAKLYTKVKNTREHYHKKLASNLEKSYRHVAVEEHGVLFMLRNRKQARAASDRGIAAMKSTLQNKLGPRYFKTPNQRPGLGGNSQTCLCGEPVPKALKDRTHSCPKCGLIAPRDVVSANVVMLIAFGRALISSTGPGQGLVRRGETEGAARMDGAEPARAVEVSVKRQPQATLDCSTTEGAEATSGADTVRHRRREPPLPAEAKRRQSVSPAEPRKHRPSGR